MALCVVIAVIYSPSLRAPFVYDDKIEVIGNPTIRFLEEWQAILLYNPSRLLLQSSYALNFHFAQLDPFPYHLSNLAIHMLTALCSLFLVEQLLLLFSYKRAVLWSALISTLWILHPMATESVIYITGRSESMCALFSLLSLGLYTKGLRENKPFVKLGGWVAILPALLTKEVAIVLPLVFLWLGYCATGRLPKRTKLIPLLLFLGIAFSTRLFIVSSEAPDLPLSDRLYALVPNEVDRPILTQLCTQMEVWIRYATLWLLPYPQTIFHHIPDLSPSSVRGMGTTIVWMFSLGFGFRNARKNPLRLFVLGAAVLLLLPSSSFATLKENMAEHRSHQFGFFFLIYLVSFLPQQNKPWKLLVPIILCLSVLSFQRNQLWRTEVSLWQEATLRAPESAPAWYGLGDAHRFAKQFEPALAAYSTCTRLDAEYFDCWNNLGITYAEMGNNPKASSIWLEVLQINPSYCKAHTNLGFLAYQQQQWEEAIVEFRSAIGKCPQNTIAHYGLGLIYYRPRFDKEKAIFHLDQVLKINPNFDYASDARKKLLELTW